MIFKYLTFKDYKNMNQIVSNGDMFKVNIILNRNVIDVIQLKIYVV